MDVHASNSMRNNQKELTLAILPFKTYSAENNLISLSQGFSEDLIVSFSKYVGLRVISQHSTIELQQPLDEKTINSLAADYLITGSFRLLGVKLRIGFQLIKAESAEVVFAGQEDQDIEQVFEVLDTITQKLVNVLQGQIDYNLLSYSYKKKNTQLSVYEKWLRGMEELKKGTLETDLIARKYFEEALRLDPNYSRAYSGISLSYFNEWSCQMWDRWDIGRKGALEYALKAIDIDENDYQALMILGRSYLYLGEFEKAEHCLRKSIRMNPSDADNLAQVAFWLVYLGYAAEALKLYDKALQLNPLHHDSYFCYGIPIFMELGEYERCIETGLKVQRSASWVDLAAFMAASYHYLDDKAKSEEFWLEYLELFRSKICDGEGDLSAKALNWHITVNPYRGETRLQAFWDYMFTEKLHTKRIVAKAEIENLTPHIINKGALWELAYANEKVILRDAKGFHDIMKLLSDPETEIHCNELMASAIEQSADNPLIDKKAKYQYQRRIQDLQLEIQEAEEFNDAERAAKLGKEYDSLLEHLSSSLGLAGRARQAGSGVEKARSAVTWRIRSAIKKIEEVHPQLAKHLSQAIKTGTFCSYKPEKVVNWQFLLLPYRAVSRT